MVAFFSMLSPFSPCSCSGDAAARRRRAAAAGTRNGARACAARWRGARALRALRAPAARRPLLRRRSGRRGTAARRRRRRNGGGTATAARDDGGGSSSGGATMRRAAAATAPRAARARDVLRRRHVAARAQIPDGGYKPTLAGPCGVPRVSSVAARAGRFKLMPTGVRSRPADALSFLGNPGFGAGRSARGGGGCARAQGQHSLHAASQPACSQLAARGVGRG